MPKLAIEEARQASLKIPWQERIRLLEYAAGRSLPALIIERNSLDFEQTERFLDLIRQREKGTPLQILVGKAAFLDIELEVGPGVFIPRPETGELVERTIDELDREPELIVELGTGTGAIAIALARRFPKARVIATDLSPLAIPLAQRNAGRLGVQDRIRFIKADLFEFREAIDLRGRAQLLISNPPYIPTGLLASLAPEVREFDPVLALDGGPNGFRVIKRILYELPDFLAPSGLAALEIDPLLGKPLGRYIKTSALRFRTEVDSYGNLRFLFVRFK